MLTYNHTGDANYGLNTTLIYLDIFHLSRYSSGTRNHRKKPRRHKLAKNNRCYLVRDKEIDTEVTNFSKQLAKVQAFIVRTKEIDRSRREQFPVVLLEIAVSSLLSPTIWTESTSTSTSKRSPRLGPFRERIKAWRGVAIRPCNFGRHDTAASSR